MIYKYIKKIKYSINRKNYKQKNMNNFNNPNNFNNMNNFNNPNAFNNMNNMNQVMNNMNNMMGWNFNMNQMNLFMQMINSNPMFLMIYNQMLQNMQMLQNQQFMQNCNPNMLMQGGAQNMQFMQNNNMNNQQYFPGQINLKFSDTTEQKNIMIQAEPKEYMSSVINKYINKSGDLNGNNLYLYNGKRIIQSLTVAELGLCDGSQIYVNNVGELKGAK